jgi:hypothetical protein
MQREVSQRRFTFAWVAKCEILNLDRVRACLKRNEPPPSQLLVLAKEKAAAEVLLITNR